MDIEDGKYSYDPNYDPVQGMIDAFFSDDGLD